MKEKKKQREEEVGEERRGGKGGIRAGQIWESTVGLTLKRVGEMKPQFISPTYL